jgi:hypothetical protein
MRETDDDTGRRPRPRSVRGSRLRTMGRRRFVETLAAAGFGGMAALLTADDVRAAGRDEVPIVYGFARDAGRFAPRKTTVPADWFADLRAALDAHREGAFVSRDGVVASGVVPGAFGGRNAAVEVAARADVDVPERVGDVSVEVTRVDPGSAAPSSVDPVESLSGTDVPGGVACGTPDSTGTLAPAMYDGRRPFFATANHVVGGDETERQGASLRLVGETASPRIGTVERGYALEDFVRVAPTNGYRPASVVRGAEPRSVVGQFSREGLAALKARDEKLEKVGVTTGRTRGKIQAIDGMTCAYGQVCKRGQLKWGSQSAFDDGDSGSVNYHPDPERPDAGVMIGGFNNARTWWPAEDYVWGTAAHHVTARYGFTFAPRGAGAR